MQREDSTYSQCVNVRGIEWPTAQPQGLGTQCRHQNAALFVSREARYPFQGHVRARTRNRHRLQAADILRRSNSHRVERENHASSSCIGHDEALRRGRVYSRRHEQLRKETDGYRHENGRLFTGSQQSWGVNTEYTKSVPHDSGKARDALQLHEFIRGNSS